VLVTGENKSFEELYVKSNLARHISARVFLRCYNVFIELYKYCLHHFPVYAAVRLKINLKGKIKNAHINSGGTALRNRLAAI